MPKRIPAFDPPAIRWSSWSPRGVSLDRMPFVEQWKHLGATRRLGAHDIFVIDRPAANEQAEPVLLLHGFPTSSFDWRFVVQPLGETRRVLALDFVGFGLSAKPDQRYSLFEQADLVEALVDELGVPQVALVSHDMGDSVAGELLARSLDDKLGFVVTRRVLTNGSIYLPLAQLTDGQKMLLAMPDAAVAADDFPQDLIEAALAATCAPDSVPPADELAATAAFVMHDGGNRLLPRTIRYVEERREHESRWTGAIEFHPSPLEVIWGDADPIAVWAMVEKLTAERPDAHVERLTGIGHYPMVEAPGEFSAALLRALA
jgi:pimeloyl-ACP methyl ester carboxylesterase